MNNNIFKFKKVIVIVGYDQEYVTSLIKFCLNPKNKLSRWITERYLKSMRTYSAEYIDKTFLLQRSYRNFINSLDYGLPYCVLTNSDYRLYKLLTKTA